jgi:S-adenosylmethionine decarboxylase
MNKRAEGGAMHATIDAWGCDPERLVDAETIRDLLDRYPGEIGMTKISEPQVLQFPDKNLQVGVSGFVFIAESHIAIHTFPDEGRVYADIFSCNVFDEVPAIAPLIRTFAPTDYRIRKLVARGVIGEEIVYPHEANIEKGIAANRRERELVGAHFGEGST